MHNIKLIRKEPDFFLKKLGHRNTKVKIKSILFLYKKKRQLIQGKKNLSKKRKLSLKKRIKVNFLDQKKYQKKLNNLISLK